MNLQCDILDSNFAFKFNLYRYIVDRLRATRVCGTGDVVDLTVGLYKLSQVDPERL